MQNTQSAFYGQQTGERILYVIRPHWVTFYILFAKFIVVATLIVFCFWLVDNQLSFLADNIDLVLIGWIPAITVIIAGILVVQNALVKNIGYLTDRRVLKFEATNPFATSIRSLSWEEAVKVKTFPANVIFKQLKIGTVIVHAKTTISSTDITKSENVVTDDDVQLTNVYYYRDLGNYIEKILFLYKKQPKEVASLQAFVPQPKGKRG